MHDKSQVEATLDAIPRLTPGVELAPFDVSGNRLAYLLIHPNGRRWKVAGSLAEVIRLIDGRTTIGTIACRASQGEACGLSQAEIRRVISGFLARNMLVALPGAEPTDRQVRRRSSLMLRIDLIPETALRPIASVMRFLFIPIVAATLISSSIGLQMFLFAATRPSFAATFSYGSNNAPLVLLLVCASFFIHELGHISACRWFGAKHGAIGFGLYLGLPVLYADVTDAWRLARSQRAVIDLAGLYFQFAFSSLLLIASMAGANPAFRWASAAIDISCLSNLNPFLKLDGYWFLSDMTGIPNLGRRIWDFLPWRWEQSSTRDFAWKPRACLWAYAMLSACFFAVFFYRMGSELFDFFKYERYIGIYYDAWVAFRFDAAGGHFDRVFAMLFQLAVPLALVVSAAILSGQILTGAIRVLRRNA